MKIYSYFITIIVGILYSCSGTSSNSTLLSKVDSLIIECPDSALTLLQSISPITLEGELQALYYLLLVQARDKNNLDITKNDSLLSISYDYYKNRSQRFRQAQVLLYQGRICEEREEADKAIEYFLHSSDLLDGIEANETKGVLYAHLGALYMQHEMFDEALKASQKACSYAMKTYNQDNKICGLRDIGRVFLLTSQTDSMTYYYERALEIAREEKDSKILNGLLSESCFAFMEKELHDKAIRNIQQSINYEQIPENLYSSYLALGYVYWDKKEYTKAKNALLKSISPLQIQNNFEAYQILFAIETERENYKEALNYQKLITECIDSIHQEEENANLLEIQNKYDHEKLRNKTQHAEHIILRQWYLLSLVLLTLIILCSIYQWLHFRNKQRYTKELGSIKIKLHNNFQELDNYQRKLYSSSQEVEHLQLLLNENKKKMQDATKDQLRYRTLLLKNQQLIKQLTDFEQIQKQYEEKSLLLLTANAQLEKKLQSKDKEPTMASLMSLFRRIKYSPSRISDEKDWLLLAQFEDMFYNSFAKKLNDYMLPPTERKVCLLLRLGLGNSEIAIIMCIESASVAKYKTRAKEKMSFSFPSSYSLHDILLII